MPYLSIKLTTSSTGNFSSQMQRVVGRTTGHFHFLLVPLIWEECGNSDWNRLYRGLGSREGLNQSSLYYTKSFPTLKKRRDILEEVWSCVHRVSHTLGLKCLIFIYKEIAYARQ